MHRRNEICCDIEGENYVHRLRYREDRRRLEIYKRDLCALYLTIGYHSYSQHVSDRVYTYLQQNKCMCTASNCLNP